MTGAATDGTKLYVFGNTYNSSTSFSVHRYLTTGSQNGQYMTPADFPGLSPAVYDIAWSGGDMWVARDEADSPVLRYDTSGEVTAYILGSEVPAAAGLTEDPSGFLWISDPDNDKIYKVDFTTSVEATYGSVSPGRALSVSQNPFSSSAAVNCSGFATGAEVSVFDLRGRVVCTGTVQSGSCTLNGSEIPPGTYLVQVRDSAGTSTLRVCRTTE